MEKFIVSDNSSNLQWKFKKYRISVKKSKKEIKLIVSRYFLVDIPIVDIIEYTTEDIEISICENSDSIFSLEYNNGQKSLAIKDNRLFWITVDKSAITFEL
ncbi:hypothetical protein KL86DYS2_13354 [uncultured Dysgonomonas sp.]|uniref:Uncharacterized protein n=1 Tax=uncultured Dysgonomonas sp. TaxID=206096 RepID=A0A212K9L0_9BACT|nr:hypothetical protein [uncultured Dysgonomonas sp.]SBW08356.1 hypothetical protein KL86DYS2_13354 [uncultured Dysgonomonas sp.]